MPCNDITEVIDISLDSSNRLIFYSLRKVSCGRAVGPESFLLDLLHGKTVSEIVTLDPHAWCFEYLPQNDIEQFLCLKHLFALRLVLEAFTGVQPGGGNQAACIISEISHDDTGVVIEAEIAVNIVTEMIKACDPRAISPKQPY